MGKENHFVQLVVPHFRHFFALRTYVLRKNLISTVQNTDTLFLRRLLLQLLLSIGKLLLECTASEQLSQEDILHMYCCP